MSNVTVHTGFWVNRDYGAVQGATLTVSIRWGNYLIAALSSLVAWAGASAWKICAFYLHQRYASKPRHDVLDQQLQVLLRGSTSSFDALFDLLEIQSAWRRRAHRVSRRVLPLLGLVVVLIVVMVAAGILVAEVASKSYQDIFVLAEPSACGNIVWDWDPAADRAERNAMIGARDTFIQDKAKFAREYARPHYSNTTGARSEAPFSRVTLPFSGREVPCPFDFDGMTKCLGPNLTAGPAWFIDSGKLDSHAHFGINAPPQNRIQWRKMATCAVVDEKNFTTQPFVVEDHFGGTKINHTYVGLRLTDGEWTPGGGTDNLTFIFNVNQPYDSLPIQVDRNIWKAKDTANRSIEMPPVRTFNRTDADVTIWIVSQSKQMGYYEPVYDPLFFANESFDFESMGIDNYAPAKWFSLLACFDSFQLCNPNNDKCTEISGIMGVTSFGGLDLNAAQTATALRFANIDNPAGVLAASSAIGSNGLLAIELGAGLTGHLLPPNQWIKEVELWFATTLVSMQAGLLDWVDKPWQESSPPKYLATKNLTSEYHDRGLASEFDTLCANQLVRAGSGIQNFGVLGTTLVIVICVVLIIVSATLPTCVHSYRQRRRRRNALSAVGERRQLARAADNRYALLRQVLEGAGVSDWEKGKYGIPVTMEPATVEPPTSIRGLARYGTGIGSISGLEKAATVTTFKSDEKGSRFHHVEEDEAADERSIATERGPETERGTEMERQERTETVNHK